MKDFKGTCLITKGFKKNCFGLVLKIENGKAYYQRQIDLGIDIRPIDR